MQISHIGNQIFYIGVNVFNNLIQMNNINNEYKMNYMNNMINMSNQMQNLINTNNLNNFNAEYFEIKKINIIFNNNNNEKITIVTLEEISVEELLKLFFKKINIIPNENKFWFLYNKKILKLDCKEMIKEYGLGNSSVISVCPKNQVIGGP